MKVYELIVEVRACFNSLAAAADELHSDLAVTASMRAVLEAVSASDEFTVPAIARTKSVSRQHIQVNVDALIAAGLLITRDNPGHKRSPFIVPTAKGRKVFAAMRRRELTRLSALARAFANEELSQAIATLRQLKEAVSVPQPKGNAND
jgi:DNA-binding MarR family transcriptional regulator